MEYLNNLVLTHLTRINKTGRDIDSLYKKQQALAVVYVNLFLGACIVVWTTLHYLGYPVYTWGIIISITPLWILSFIYLKKGDLETAKTLILIYMQAEIIVTHKISGMLLSSIVSVMICPPTASLLAVSARKQYINGAFSMIQLLSIFSECVEMFKVTLTEDQSANCFQMYVAAFLLGGFVVVVSFIQQDYGVYLWKLAESNYERAEKINKEVLQAIEAKDTFVSSLSHEIRNPLNALKGSIDFLMKGVSDPVHLQILENAHISSEVLLNLVNNVLDAAKLKSDKMDIAHVETNLIDTIKKVVMIHYDRLREKEMSPQVFIHKNLPLSIWIDSSRLLQIIMNLISNAIKFTNRRGRIHLYVSWCDSETKREHLLKPNEEDGPQNYTKKLLSKKSSGSISSQSEVQQPTKLLLDNSYELFNADEYSLFKSDSPTIKIKRATPHESKRLSAINCKESKLHNQYIVWNINTLHGLNMQPLMEAYYALCDLPRSSQVKGFLKIQVSDTGCGIAEEHIPKMFEMFSQAGRDVASIYGGSGLGLWLCKQLTQRMGGDIAMYSKENVGTTFVFYVPTNNDTLLSEDLRSDLNFRRREVRGLVVDDYAYNRDIHKLLLEREGICVDLACDGQEALDKYIAQGDFYYDFIMLDIQMPVMDGFTAAVKIREWEKKNNWKYTNIYFVSGEYYNEKDITRELKEKGAMREITGVRCMRKPIDIELIKKMVEKYTRRRRHSTSSFSSSDGGKSSTNISESKKTD